MTLQRHRGVCPRGQMNKLNKKICLIDINGHDIIHNTSRRLNNIKLIVFKLHEL